jgi:hypothetical protein
MEANYSKFIVCHVLFLPQVISFCSIVWCSTMPENLRDQLLLTIMRTFHCTSDKAEQIFIELMMCIRKRHLASFLCLINYRVAVFQIICWRDLFRIIVVILENLQSLFKQEDYLIDEWLKDCG